ncbi:MULTISPECIES: amino acid transporter [Phyllobacterium]|uniref:amino acid transporter n=1 Tax=Phyllobacterium TaxID=28100 RepID=UPI001FDFB5DD|nr:MULTISPECIES: amino acid transporter [Phyllobacterium]UXN63374.1 amino acid transporter [Phyllobacterium sp. A18/5-2]
MDIFTTVHNERTKLTAAWFNGASVALYAVGGLAPMASSIYNSGGPNLLIAGGTVICILAATALHLFARRILKGLKP